MHSDPTSKIDQLNTSLILQINKVSESSDSSLSSKNQNSCKPISDFSFKIDQLQTSEAEIQNQMKETTDDLFNFHDLSSVFSHSLVAVTVIQGL